MKRCTKCGVNKHLEQYHRAIRESDGHQDQCKACKAVYHRSYYLREKAEGRGRYNRSGHLARKYSLTEFEYERLRITQGNRCAICAIPQAKQDRRMAVDHDHETGAVRGLLCRKCNAALGLFQDNPKLLRTALRYLSQTKGQDAEVQDNVLSLSR